MARVRRGRGLDFSLRLQTSQWAEGLLLDELNREGFDAYRLGLSESSADNTPRPTDSRYKVPDLVAFAPGALASDEREFLRQHDLTQLMPDDLSPGTRLYDILGKACCAIEVEFSPYRASEMKGRHWTPITPAQLQRRPRKKATPPTAPNIWIKHEDLTPLMAWQRMMKIPILVAHVFDQEAFAIPLEEVERFHAQVSAPGADAIMLQLTHGVFTQEQIYDRVDAQGARERKQVLVVTPAVAQRVGPVLDVVVRVQQGLSASKKYVSHVCFEGGRIEFDPGFVRLLRDGHRDK